MLWVRKNSRIFVVVNLIVSRQLTQEGLETEGATLQHLSTCLGRGIKHFSDKLHHASKAEFQDHPSAGRFVNFFLSDPIISLASNEDTLDPGTVIFSLYPSSS